MKDFIIIRLDRQPNVQNPKFILQNLKRNWANPVANYEIEMVASINFYCFESNIKQKPFAILDTSSLLNGSKIQWNTVVLYGIVYAVIKQSYPFRCYNIDKCLRNIIIIIIT